jgi:hypothetical protein
MSRSARFGLVILAAVLAGCSGATPTPAPNASDHATPAGVAPSPTSSAPTQTQPEPTPTVPAPTPSATTATAAPAAETLPPYGVAIAIQDDVVIRSKPGVGADSEIYKPSLSRGDQVLVVGGPVRASGYDWYDVRPLAARLPSSGWVAQASKAGEPWIAPGRATCPPVPTTFATLAALTDGQQLACFSRVPITVSARLWRFVGSVDPGYNWVPDWFGTTGYVLVDPTVAAPDGTATKPFFLVLDPAGTHLNPLPVGKVVEVIGMFDHPAASGCTATLASPPEVLLDFCRYQFVVASMK